MAEANTNTLNQVPNSAPPRDARGRLLPGHKMGRPLGSTNRRGKAEIDRLDQRSGAVWAVVDRRLSEGCVKTALFLLSRMLPADRPVEADTSNPVALADAMAEGLLSPVESNRLAQAARSLAEIEQIDEMRSRLDEIEALLLRQGRGS